MINNTQIIVGDYEDAVQRVRRERISFPRLYSHSL